MMKKLTIVLFVLLGVQSLSAQLYHNGVYISLEGGLAFPLNSFGTSGTAEDGYAKTGFLGIAGIGYKFSPQVSAGLKVAFSHHGVDANESIFPGQDPWRSTFLLGGVSIAQQLSSYFVIDAELGGGIVFTQFPVANLTIDGQEVAREAATGDGFAFQGGVGAKYVLDEFLAFRLGVDYMSGRPQFTTDVMKFDQKVSMLTTSWGIIFML